MSSRGLAIRTALVLCGLVACSVGEVPTNTGPDGGNGNNACVAKVAPPASGHTHLAGGGTNAGQNCVAGGCHLAGNTGTNAPAYQFGGTVYVAGTTNPSAGATVQIKVGTMAYPAVTDEAGNFSFAAGTVKGTFSATVVVSACPAVMSMPDALVSGGDPSETNCNGCHGLAGSKPPITL
jgi:hypothetical protein